MTENQKLKMELLKQFTISDEPKTIEVCRQMYKFMVEDEAPTPSVPTNGNYIDAYIDAVADWNGQKNTEHLKAVGLSDNISLSDGWYIPSMGEMLFIFTHRKEVNAALEKAGGQPIADDWYWTSTEYSATHAWYLNLYDGFMLNGPKATTTHRVRPVSAFIS